MMFSKFLFGAALAVAAIVGISPSPAQAFQVPVLVENNTDHQFVRFYARNYGSNSEGNLLELDLWSNPIRSGEKRVIFINAKSCENWNLELDRRPNIMTKAEHVNICNGVRWPINWRNADNFTSQWGLTPYGQAAYFTVPAPAPFLRAVQ